MSHHLKLNLRAISPAVRRWLPSRGNVLFTLLVLASLFFAGRAGAIPGFAPAGPDGASTGLIAYQGRLTDAAGAPLTGSYPMTFALYTAATGGAALWSESRTVAATDGVFSVMLGEVTPIPASVAANTSLYLGVTVGSDVEMTPRKQLGSVAYAFQALTVADGSVTTAKIADGAVTQAKLDVRMPRFLGQKTCDDCGSPTETNGPENTWLPVKGANSQDVIEVSATTQGGVIMVLMTSRYYLNPVDIPWCGIAVYQGATRIRFAHIDGEGPTVNAFGCSGSYVFGDLPSGTYKFRAVVWMGSGHNIQWVFERQIAVFEY